MKEEFPENFSQSVADFFEYIHPYVKSTGVIEEVFNSNLFPLQRKEELARMLEIAWEVQPKVIMEIGCDKGGGLYHWAKMAPQALIIGNELKGTPYAEEFERGFPENEWHWMPGSSRDPLLLEGLGKKLNGRKIDVLFIDGCKRSMYQDFETYLGFMSDRGVVFFHDIQDEYPGKAWLEVAKLMKFKTAPIIKKDECWEALARKQGGEKPKNTWDGWLMHWEGKSCGVGVVWLGHQ